MIGKIISHYKILEKLGEGGMGVVYKAEDTKLHRTVALKFLPQEFTRDDSAKKRFINEARAASSLQHNNVCNIHDIDETEDGQIFICMDCYDGKTLREIIVETRHSASLPITEIIDITKQIAEGLKKAHDNGIVHRDIKPANIFITKDGVVKILDFGLAKLSDRTQITGLGETGGTLAYMSPEQAGGQNVDLRTDIWSLGVVLYEMLTGELPFKSEYEQAVIYSILNEGYPEISTLRPETPEYLIELVNKCLKKNKDERIQTANDIFISLDIQKSHSKNNFKKLIASPLRKYLLLTIVLLLIVAVWFFIPKLLFTSSQKYTLGILSFRNETKDSTCMNWPLIIQQIFDEKLIGNFEDLAIKNHENVNGLVNNASVAAPSFNEILQYLSGEGITYTIDGSIIKSNNKYRIDISLVNTSDGKSLLSETEQFEDGKQLYKAIENLARKINNYLYVKVFNSDKDLKNWMKKESINYEALKKFQLAKELIFHLQNAYPVLHEAVELDSTFISPRIWMFPKLIRKDSTEVLNKHYNFLLKMLPSANPFEQAMIYYAGALKSKDIYGQARYLRSALDYSPGDPILLHNLALVQSSLCNYEDALETLQPNLKIKWTFPPLYELAAECYIKTGNVDEAKNILEESLTLSLPTITEKIYALLSVIYWKENDFTNSLKYEKLSLARYNEQMVSTDLTYKILSDCYSNLGLYDKAMEKIKKALEINPDESLYRAKSAEILFDKGDYKNSETECKAAMNLKPASARVFFILGKLFDRTGNTKLADENYKSFYNLDSLNCDAIKLKSRLRK
jgi:serine/threonine protein kinase/Flp pilus assembly protein TadD